MNQPFYDSKMRKTSAIATICMSCLLIFISSCGNDSKKKVPVTGNGNGLNGLPQNSGVSGPGLVLLHPQTQQPVPATLTMAQGDTVSMAIQVSGISGSDMSYGFMSKDGLVIQISGSQLTLSNVPHGLHSFSVVARSSSDCEKLGKQNCRPNGRPVEGIQVFDIEKKYVVNAIDPNVEYTKKDSTGGGMAGQMARGEGFIGFIGKMFMGGNGGLGGMLGGLGGTTPQQGVPQQGAPQQGYPPQQPPY